MGEDGATLDSDVRQLRARSVPALNNGFILAEQRSATTAHRVLVEPQGSTGLSVLRGDHHGHAAVGVWVQGDRAPYVYHAIHADGTCLSFDPLVASSLDVGDMTALRFGVWAPVDDRRIALSSRSAWLDPAIDRVALTRSELTVSDAGDTISGTGLAELAILSSGGRPPLCQQPVALPWLPSGASPNVVTMMHRQRLS